MSEGKRDWRDEAADYVIAKARQVIETFGPREPGSQAEADAQHFVREELSDCADEIEIEPFTLSPKAFLGFVPITGFLFTGTALLCGAHPWIALGLSVLGLLMAVLQFGMYKRFLDPFFSRRTSHNVYAVRRATGETHRRIIFGGHVDSAYEMRFNLYGRWALMMVFVWGICGGLFCLLLSLVQAVAGAVLMDWFPAVWPWIVMTPYLCIPGFVMLIFFIRFNVVVPGANDNLSGVFSAIAVMKRLQAQNLRFEHTEVCCLITGSEEAGLRGAKAFVEKHGDMLRRTETAFVALDTMRDTDYLTIYARDLNGTVRHHKGLVRLMRTAGERQGINMPIGSVYMGSSDATAFTQAGIPAVALGGMDPAPPRYYHTRLDDWRIMEPECIRRTVGVSMESLLRFDQLPECGEMDA